MAGKMATADGRRGISFVAPGVIVTAILVLFPISYVLYMSVMRGKEFAGFGNFREIASDPQFGQMIGNTALWTVLTVGLAFLLGTATALLIHQDFIKGKGIWRTVLLLSWITPGVVKATVWKWMYSTDFGILNHMLVSAGIIGEPVSWLMNPAYSLGAVILVQVWATFPFVMLMISAGLQAIPKDLFEVAHLEGATFVHRLRYIYVPQLRDVLFISLLLLVIWSLNEFAVIWIVTQGGPAGSSQVLSLSIYEKFRSFDLNGAAAVSVIQLFASLVFALWYIRKTGKEER